MWLAVGKGPPPSKIMIGTGLDMTDLVSSGPGCSEAKWQIIELFLDPLVSGRGCWVTAADALITSFKSSDTLRESNKRDN